MVTSVPAPTTTIQTFEDGPVGEVCDDMIVVQASDFPDVGGGPLYALRGAAPVVDADRQAVAGPLTRADGTVEDASLEIRSGGPAVGFRSPISVMADDDSIDLAIVSTAVAVCDRSQLPTHAVMSLTDRSRDALMVDPATYPDVDDVAELGAQGIAVRHVTDGPVIAFLAASGALRPDQLVPGSDGLPASFVGARGEVVQQGELTIDPVLLPTLPQWGRPVDALPAFDAGWSSLDDMVVAADTDADTDTNVAVDAKRLSDECLGRLVRIMQQSIVAYVAEPAATNVVMSNVRAQFDPLARLTPELLDAGTRLAVEAGVFDADRSDPPGAIDADGFDEFLLDLASALQVEPVSFDELVDPRFIDSTISR